MMRFASVGPLKTKAIATITKAAAPTFAEMPERSTASSTSLMPVDWAWLAAATVRAVRPAPNLAALVLQNQMHE